MKWLLFLLLCTPVFSQTAVVRELSSEDAKDIKQAYETKVWAEEYYDKIRKSIILKNTQDKNSVIFYGNGVPIISENYDTDNWEFSSDFKFIVPKHEDSLDKGPQDFSWECRKKQSPIWGGTFTTPDGDNKYMNCGTSSCTITTPTPQ